MTAIKPIDPVSLRRLFSQGKTLCLAGRPVDGDSLASALALRRLIIQMGGQADAACADAQPESLHFLPDCELVLQKPELLVYSSIVILDCGELKLTGFEPELSQLIKANPASNNPHLPSVIDIDHHQQQPAYGHFTVLDRSAASTGLIIHGLATAWQQALDVQTATALLATLYYDTGSFQHANTDARALRMAADCVRSGANAGHVATKLYRNKTTKALRLWGRALERLELHAGSGMALSVLLQKDYLELGVTPDQANGIVSFLSHVPECRFALLLAEEEAGTVKGSLRSNEHKNTDVASIARALGGGGHRLASGFKVPGRIQNKAGRYQVV